MCAGRFLGGDGSLTIDHEHVRGGLGPRATPLIRAPISVHVFRVTSLLELDFLDLLLCGDNCLFRLIDVSRRAPSIRLRVMIILAMGRLDPPRLLLLGSRLL